MSDRVPYYFEYGSEPTGTCLPISAHTLLVTFESYQPDGSIICPENGCIQSDDSTNGECWLETWWAEVGWELVSSPDTVHSVEVNIDGEGGEETAIWVTGVKADG